MDGKHEGLNGEAWEREIEAALGVDPSPAFLPRIRERIANERMGGAWLGAASWRWAGAVGIALAVAIVGVWSLRDPMLPMRESGSGIRDSGFGIRDSGSDGAVGSVPPESPERIRVPADRAARAAARPVVAAPAEVLVSPDEAAALRQLVAAIATGQVEAMDIPELGAEPEPLPPIEAIVLEPIELSPIEGLKSE